MKVVCENREARHQYFILDSVEAGISLDGGEVKSIRLGNVNIKDSYCSVAKNGVFIKNMHVSVYDKSGAYNVREAVRDRRLLLHKSEINKIMAKVAEKGYTVVPLKIYFKQSLIKVELGICKGKHTFDKKQTLKERDLDRAAQRELAKY